MTYYSNVLVSEMLRRVFKIVSDYAVTFVLFLRSEPWKYMHSE